MAFPIALVAVNARYLHSALGLRYLKANLGPLASECTLLEFTIAQQVADMVERILVERPRVVGVGVYVWNARVARDLVATLKRVAPECVVVVGGPEVSHEHPHQEIVQLADHVVLGEGETAFRTLCESYAAGAPTPPRVLEGGMPNVAELTLPYAGYTDEDVAHRIVYVEASRGCPFRCEFCLSALDAGVRPFPVEPFLQAMECLLDRGVQHFKFVDRTFNLRLETTTRILNFFLQRYQPGLFLHFEMIPDRLPEGLRALVARFPPGSLQLEIGIQTFDPAVAARIQRRQNYDRTVDNLRFLRQQTSAHLHTDLIIGLPGEDLETFAKGFDRLVALEPQEIQVGILKRLRGAPIARHTGSFDLTFSDHAPYEVLSTSTLDFQTLQCLKRFAHLWNVVSNSGNFCVTAPYLWAERSPFEGFWSFTEGVFQKMGRVHSIALDRLTALIFEHATNVQELPADRVLEALQKDYERCGRAFPRSLGRAPKRSSGFRASRRQLRHIVTAEPKAP